MSCSGRKWKNWIVGKKNPKSYGLIKTKNIQGRANAIVVLTCRMVTGQLVTIITLSLWGPSCSLEEGNVNYLCRVLCCSGTCDDSEFEAVTVLWSSVENLLGRVCQNNWLHACRNAQGVSSWEVHKSASSGGLRSLRSEQGEREEVWVKCFI